MKQALPKSVHVAEIRSLTPVVFDASAGVDLVANTEHGRALRPLPPSDAIGWVPEHFYLECAAVLRWRDLHRALPADQIAEAFDELVAGPLHIVDVKGLLPGSWQLRANGTMGDAPYVILARHLDAPLVTVDAPLTRAPGLGVELERLEDDSPSG
ncbi:MAG: type II toxin-antitoxin system VapC family toxin [Candidatus Dormibacteraceae bacterium]